MRDYPQYTTPSWGDEDYFANGIAHDNGNWYICSNESNGTVGEADGDWKMWRIPRTQDINQDFTNNPAVLTFRKDLEPRLLQPYDYTHAGDLDCFTHNGIDYLAVPLSGGPKPVIAFFEADNLSLINTAVLSEQSTVGWCAVDPNGFLYSSQDDAFAIIKYEIVWTSGQPSLRYKEFFPFRTSDGGPLLEPIHDMQGGAFTPSGDLLYVSSGLLECALAGTVKHDEDGIHVFETIDWKEIKHSTNSSRGETGSFDFAFDNGDCGAEEPEGLDIWDICLGQGNVCGQLHVLVNDHSYVFWESDKTSLKHFAALQAPILTLPLNGSACVPRVATLKWSDVGRDDYYIVINQSPDFDMPEFTVTKSGGTNEVNTPQLKFGTKYYWQVYGITSNCKPGAFSKVFSFTTEPAIIPVKLATIPAGFSYVVDGTTYTAGRTFNWSNGSSHTLTIRESVQQITADSAYLFAQWVGDVSRYSIDTSIVVGPTCAGDGFTAVFDRAYFLTTVPEGNGVVSPPSGWFKGNSDIFVSVTDTGTIPFAGWIGIGNGSYSGCFNPATVTMNGPITQEATFDSNPATVQVSLAASRPEINMSFIDNSGDSSNKFCWIPGSKHQISAPEFVMIRQEPGGIHDSLRIRFVSWSDGGDRMHDIIVPSRATSYLANYVLQYRVSFEIQGGVGTLSPPGGWFDSGQVVTIVATPNCGYRFEKWDGVGYKGTDSSAEITVLDNILQRATFRSEGQSLLLASDTIRTVSGMALTDFSWVDFNENGRPDLFAYDQGNKKGWFYDNLETGYGEIASGFEFAGVPRDMQWIDYDNDGDLDYFGVDEQIPTLFRAESGALVKTSYAFFSNPAVETSQWIDFDNDGDLDYFALFNQRPRLFANHSTGFTELANVWMDTGIVANLQWIDFDNDRDLDLSYVVDNSPLLLKNDNSTFTRLAVHPASTDQIVDPQWIDFDADGDLDYFAITGRYANVFKNDNDAFTEVTMPWSNWPNGVLLTNAQWGDFDGDGLRDFFGVQQNGTNRGKAEFYRKSGGNYVEQSFLLDGNIALLDFIWVDFDCDGDLDLTIIDSIANSFNLYANTGDSISETPSEFALGEFRSPLQWLNIDLVGNLDLFSYESGSAIVRSTKTCIQNGISVTLVPTSTHARAFVATLDIESGGIVTKRVISNYSNLNRIEVCGLGAEGEYCSITVNWASGKTVRLVDIPPYSHVVTMERQDILTDVDDSGGGALPSSFSVSQNYPNPFNPKTTIEYSVESRAFVSIGIFNVLGQNVRTLVNEIKSAGNYRIDWDGVDDAGKGVSSGVYWYRFRANDVVQTKKMVLLK